MKPEDKAVVQQALEALEVASSYVDGYYLPEGKTLLPEVESAITALRQLLEQPEPVFCEYCGGNDDADFGLPTDHCTDCDRPDPTQPSTEDSSEVDHADELTIAYLDGVHTGKRLVKREWVGLTDEEIDKNLSEDAQGDCEMHEFARAIDAKLREKNGGAA